MWFAGFNHKIRVFVWQNLHRGRDGPGVVAAGLVVLLRVYGSAGLIMIVVIPHVQACVGGGPARLADPFEVGFEVTHDPLLHVAVGGVLFKHDLVLILY